MPHNKLEKILALFPYSEKRSLVPDSDANILRNHVPRDHCIG
jgi:hypothetical protein